MTTLSCLMPDLAPCDASLTLPWLRSSLSRDWTVVIVVTMVPSGITVLSTSTFLVGVREERIGKALWTMRGSSVSTNDTWRNINNPLHSFQFAHAMRAEPFTNINVDPTNLTHTVLTAPSITNKTILMNWMSRKKLIITQSQNLLLHQIYMEFLPKINWLISTHIGCQKLINHCVKLSGGHGLTVHNHMLLGGAGW